MEALASSSGTCSSRRCVIRVGEVIACGDPVASGLVDSLARPGGNITGLSYYATELTAKRLELLREAVPRIAKIGVLANPAVAYLPFVTDTVRAAATLGLSAAIHQV